jgi:hypothetical protein
MKTGFVTAAIAVVLIYALTGCAVPPERQELYRRAALVAVKTYIETRSTK